MDQRVGATQCPRLKRGGLGVSSKGVTPLNYSPLGKSGIKEEG